MGIAETVSKFISYSTHKITTVFSKKDNNINQTSNLGFSSLIKNNEKENNIPNASGTLGNYIKPWNNLIRPNKTPDKSTFLFGNK